MVHQPLILVPTLTVAENCAIGRRDWGWRFDPARVAGQIQELGNRIGLHVEPTARIESLSVGERQRVEIIRALSGDSSVLILDEPTAVLTPQETEQLFKALTKLRDDGLAIVFISHKLDEVEQVCDEVTILRRGRVVHQGVAAALGRDDMARHMVGSEVPALSSRDTSKPEGPIRLELSGISAESPVAQRRIRNLSLVVRSGEVLGIAGVEGNGQDVLAAVVAGVIQPGMGVITFDDNDVTRMGVRQRYQRGLANIAEDRITQSLVPEMTLADNLMLRHHRNAPFSRFGWMNRHQIGEHANDRLSAFNIQPSDVNAMAGQLSGGNQQKLVLARELDGSPRCIVAHNPVRGLDVAATRFVFDQLLEQRRRGAAILLIHSDLDELFTVADRIMVLYRGELHETRWPDCDRDEIGRLMLGGVS